MTCRTVITENTANAFTKGDWGVRHVQAVTKPQGAEVGILALFFGLAEYADRHAKRFSSPLAEDYFLGPAWLGMLKGVRVLLNGETGRLDCGTLDRLVYALANAAGFKDSETDL